MAKKRIDDYISSAEDSHYLALERVGKLNNEDSNRMRSLKKSTLNKFISSAKDYAKAAELAESEGFIEDGQVPTLKLYKSSTGEMINLDADLDGFSNLLVSDIELAKGEILIIPNVFALHPSYPNPFNPVTTISYGLPLESDITLNIYDVEGRRITTLTEGIRTAGTHTVEWNADGYPSGVYFVKLDAGEFTQTQNLMLVK